ncbi:nucleotide exchange factor GrpE [Chamaesiphon polymorphus]|nr:nucleotide exchange factor GrpE [Chamaesiphon polymorphus]
MTFTRIIHLFDRTEEREIRQLALTAEAKVHRLSGGNALQFDQEQDLVVILTSMNKLLDRLLDRWHDRKQEDNSASTAIVRHHKNVDPNPPSVSSPTDLEESTPIPAIPLLQISPSAVRTIDLRDWLLLANSTPARESIAPQILTVIDDKLRNILATEGIMEIVDTGNFDTHRHQIVETQPTIAPEQHETIARTIRPGYRHHDRLIRSQAVILYIFAPENSTAPA